MLKNKLQRPEFDRCEAFDFAGQHRDAAVAHGDAPAGQLMQ